MEMPEALSQFKKSLAKYAKGRLLHLAEAAEILKIKEEQLTDLARRGKIRAFKAGEHWFMEEAWLEDFRALVKKSLKHEIENYRFSVAHRHGWTRPLAPRRKLKRRLASPAVFFKRAVQRMKRPAVRSWQSFLGYLALANKIIFLIFKAMAATVLLALIGIGFGLLALPLARVGLNRDSLAVNFLNATYRTYELPASYVRELPFGSPIDDEKLTRAFYRLVGRNALGQVAGVFEADIK